MGAESLFNATMSVLRKTEGARDSHNQPAGSWGTASTGNACRMEGAGAAPGSERSLTLGAGQVVQYDCVIFCGVSVDVTERDRIVVGTRTVEVKYVNREPGGVVDSHFEIYGVEVRV